MRAARIPRDSVSRFVMVLVGTLVLIALSAQGATGAPPGYYLVPLPSPATAPNGAYESRGLGVNNVGHAVGTANLYQSPTAQPPWGVSWTLSGAPDLLLDPFAFTGSTLQRSSANAINNAGTIVGAAAQSDGNGFEGHIAARWLPGTTTPIALPTPGGKISGAVASIALSINSSGEIVGRVDRYDSQDNYLGQFAVRWDASTFSMTPLDFIGFNSTGQSSATAHDLNDGGTTVGSASAYVGGIERGLRAVRWDSGGTAATTLGNLGTNAAGTTRSEAYSINNAGTAVGYANLYSGNTLLGMRAIGWKAGSSTPLELASRGVDTAGKTTSYASSINNHGQIVGTSWGYNQVGQLMQDGGAAYWDSDGTVYGLASLVTNLDGWKLFEGREISDSGYITGYGSDGKGNTSAFLLIPVPEGESFTLLALGLLACGFRWCHSSRLRVRTS